MTFPPVVGVPVSDALFSQFCQWFQALSETEKFQAGRQFQALTGGTLSAYANPKPVAVGVVPVQTPEGVRLLGVRRAIEPRLGAVALPGGFMDELERPAQAAAREVAEETGITLPEERFAAFGEPVATGNGTLLMFYACSSALSHEDFQRANEQLSQTTDGEASELVLVGPGDTLGFPLHQAAVAAYFARPRPA